MADETYEEIVARHRKENGGGGASQIPNENEYANIVEKHRKAVAAEAAAPAPKESTRPPATPLADFEGQTLQFGPWDTGVPLPAGTVRSLAQIGSGLANWPLGYKQLINDLHAHAGLKPQFEGIDRSTADEKRKLDDPLNRGFWGGANSFLGNMAPAMLAPASLPASMVRAAPSALPILGALTGAAQGAVAPVGTGESRTANTLIGSAGGAAIPGLKYGLQKAAGWHDPAQNALAREAIERGVKSFGLADTADPGFMTAIRHVANALPFSKGYIGKVADKREKEFTRAVGNVIGMNTDDLTSAAVNAHHKTLEDSLKSTWAAKPFVVTRQLENQLNALEAQANKYDRAVSGPITDRIQAFRDRIQTRVGVDPVSGLPYRQNVVPGDVAFNFQDGWRKAYGTVPRNADEHQLNPLMRDLRKAVTDTFEGSLTPEEVQAARALDTQLQATKAILPATSKAEVGQAQREAGSMAPKDLSDRILNYYRNNQTDSPFGQLPQIGQQILRDTSTKDRTILANSALPALGILGGAGGSMGYISNPNAVGILPALAMGATGLISTTGAVGGALSSPGVSKWVLKDSPGIVEAAARAAAVQGPLAWRENTQAGETLGPLPDEPEEKEPYRVEVRGTRENMTPADWAAIRAQGVN